MADWKVWSANECNTLLAAVKEHGEKWDIVSPITGRSPRACRDKYLKTSDRPRNRWPQAPDLTPEQTTQARQLRAGGIRDLRQLASVMGVKQVQLVRVFKPHWLKNKIRNSERRSAAVNYARHHVMTVPDSVIIEREIAYAEYSDISRMTGDPPRGRSALDRRQANGI